MRAVFDVGEKKSWQGRCVHRRFGPALHGKV